MGLKTLNLSSATGVEEVTADDDEMGDADLVDASKLGDNDFRVICACL